MIFICCSWLHVQFFCYKQDLNVSSGVYCIKKKHSEVGSGVCKDADVGVEQILVFTLIIIGCREKVFISVWNLNKVVNRFGRSWEIFKVALLCLNSRVKILGGLLNYFLLYNSILKGLFKGVNNMSIRLI